MNHKIGVNNDTLIFTALSKNIGTKRTSVVTVSGSGVTDQIINVIQDSIPSSEININELVNIYPNPASNYIYVELKDINVQTFIEIYDEQGICKFHCMVNGNTTPISLDGFNCGLFIVKISNAQGNVIKKIIKD